VNIAQLPIVHILAPRVAETAAGPMTIESPTAALGTVAQHRCPTCDATLAIDQRYCVECGERVGPPRLPVMDPRAQQVREATVAASPPRRFSPTSGTTLVAGVATLLLALGVGVLIGHSAKSNQTSAARAPVQVVTVAGGAAGPGASTTAAAAAGAGAATHAAKSHKLSAAKRKALAKKAESAATVNKVLKPTKSAGKLPPAKVKVGSKCSNGRGCQNGKFTGNFFGGG
jgi:hypothetical protein